MKFPKHILDSLRQNKTSIGDNPSLPPELEDKFLVSLLKRYYGDRLSEVGDDSEEVKNELSSALSKCIRIEHSIIPALEKLCEKVINELFEIPNDTVNITMKIVRHIDTKGQRLVPEDTVDYSFDSIDDMNGLTDEIYKRRFLNCLVCGAAAYYASQMKRYVADLFDINGELPNLYKKIFTMNCAQSFCVSDNMKRGCMDGGKVDVFLSSNDGVSTIKSEGVIFPVLLEETIKGILELAISYGLPDDIDKASFITGKADFKLAEVWDQRLGLPLWSQIEKTLHSINADTSEVGLNFLFMEMSMLKPKSFNTFMQEVLSDTKYGRRLMNKMVDKIRYKKNQDDFDDYMDTQGQINYQIDDDEEFTSDDLLNDGLCNSLVMDSEDNGQ